MAGAADHRAGNQAGRYTGSKPAVTAAKSTASITAAREVSAASMKTAGTIPALCERRGRCCERYRQTGSTDSSKFYHDCFS
jgi:hypothetical protein